jgi:hypothetical protein
MKIALGFIAYPLLVITATAANGDGIPVAPDRKSVTVETFTIPLSEGQMAQVEQRREVTLTKDQLAPLRVIYEKIPTTIEVVSSRYDSCTCDMVIYGIWCRPGEIEIPKHSLECRKESDEYEAKNPTPEEGIDDKSHSVNYESEGLMLDAVGTLYRDGKVIKESEVLALVDAMYERRKQNNLLNAWLTLDAPPPINDATDSKIRELAIRIASHCDARGIGFWAAGISEGYR